MFYNSCNNYDPPGKTNVELSDTTSAFNYHVLTEKLHMFTLRKSAVMAIYYKMVRPLNFKKQMSKYCLVNSQMRSFMCQE